MGRYLRSPVFAAAVVAVVLFLALSASTASAKIPRNKYFRVPKCTLNITGKPDPTKVRPGRPPTSEPTNDYDRVFRCWGYLGNNQAVGWVKLFFLNGTLPSHNVCQGVLNLHRHCWPDMFNIWWFVDDKRIGHLHNHCVKTVALGHGSP